MTRALREASESGELRPGFQDFLDAGVVDRSILEADFGVARPIPLVSWAPRTNLIRLPDTGSGERIWVPGVTAEMRAFRFTPPPALLAPDSVAVFQPSRLGELVRDQVCLLQLRGRHATRQLRASVGHLGRVVVSRTKGRILCQFEPATANVPIVDVTERAVEALFVCTFRGRYTTR
jgi:hypothetical protein